MKAFDDHSKMFIFKTILFNNRLDYYKKYLQLARTNQYEILSLFDFFKLGDKRNGKHLILRHDVDSVGISTRKMFELERNAGLTSTYYFRFSTIDVPLIHEMINEGFEVGLHYETVSDYIRENGCTDKKQINLKQMRERLSKEIRSFEDIIGYKTTSCCSHGAYENSKLEISNNVLTEKQNMDDFGLKFEAYSAELYEKYIDCHIMDNDVIYNYGFSYKDTPISAIIQNKQNIVLLAHPKHWFYDTPARQIWKVIALILRRATYSTERSFKRIAD